MPKNIERGLFETIKSTPEFRDNDVRVKDFLEAMERLQRLERDNKGREVVVRKVNTNDPIQIVVASDWHLGSLSSDIDEMMKIRDYILDNDNVGVVFAGDEIEGLTAKYLTTNAATTPIDVQQQIEFLKIMFFEPLAMKKKILGMVSEYWGHPGWATDATTVNTWRVMVGSLDIPIIQNGGSLVLSFPNGYEHTMKLWHNPPGASKYDELSGQRDVMLGTSESARPRGSVSGHIHRQGVAEESYAGAKSRVYYISAGTTKGSSADKPRDGFGVRLGAGLAEPQGQGVTIIPKRGRREDMNIPFASLKQGEMMMKAVDLLNKTESSGTTKELLATIRKKVEEAPQIYYASASSRLGHRYKEDRPLDKLKVGGETIRNPYSGMEMKVPYDTLSYEIQSRLPVRLELIANTLLGSSSEGLKDLKGHIKTITENPHALMVFLRNMIDKGAGDLPNRIEVLDKFVDMLNGGKNQTLAIMMCESMRQGSWKKKVGKLPRHMPVAPASYIANVCGLPLVHHLSLLKLSIGPGRGPKTLYSGVLADKLEGHGSGSKPEWGLQRLYDLHIHEKPGFVAGGHMANAGAMIFYDGSNAETKQPMLVAPGWWAKAVDSIGKGNVKPGAEPGQAIIFLPGRSQADYGAFPTVNSEEAEYVHDSLTLTLGLEILGLTDKVRSRK